MPAPAGFVAFKGQGNRLDGKKRKDSGTNVIANKPTYVRGIPDYDYKVGTLTFLRNIKPVNSKEVSCYLIQYTLAFNRVNVNTNKLSTGKHFLFFVSWLLVSNQYI